jgi:hypothetical protein
MEFLMDGIRWTHVGFGFIGLAAFWVPIVTFKGGKNHRFFGKIFKYCAYVVLFAAMISVALHTVMGISEGVTPADQPSQYGFLFFLGYLALVTYVALRHGMQVLLQKKDISTLDTTLNRSMARLAILGSVAIIAYAFYYKPSSMVVLLALSPVGFATGFRILKALKGKRPEKKAWFYEHMGAMIGTGIAFHTAFAVFGSQALFDLGLDGFIAIIPWILPAMIGIPGNIIWTNHYMRKFGDKPAKGQAMETAA